MRSAYLFGCCSFLAFATCLNARAQSLPPPTAQNAATSLAPRTKPATGGLEEVTVTAQRRSQNLQNVPIAVTALSAKDIAQQQVNETADIPRLVPNMFANNVVGTGSGNVYFLRGLGQTESFPTFDPQVGTYVDDIYIGRESGSNFGLFDVSQIQVLRGPQGTLFGRNSTGGAIVITLAKPAPEFGGYLDVGYGAYNRFFGRGAVNMPISPDILTKFSFYGIRDDGYVKDVATGSRLNAHGDWGVREDVTIAPHRLENVTWNLSADVSDTTYNAVQNTPVNGDRISYSGFGNLGAPIPVIGGSAAIADFDKILKQNFTGLANAEDFKSGGFMSNLQIAFDAGNLNLISGFRDQSQISANDFPFPGASGPIVPYDNNELGQFGIVLNSSDMQYSQEVKWTGKVGDFLTYTAGGFYLYEENSTDFIETLTVPAGSKPSAGVFGFELSPAEHFHNTTQSQAVYAQADYKIIDPLTFTVGARLTHEDKAYRVNSAGYDDGALALGPSYDTADVLAAGNRTKLKTDQLTPRFALEYRITPQLMAFASATRGFQGGGWNSLTAGAQTVTAFGPETLWTYEAGERYRTPDGKLQVNADIFYNNVHNYQLITLGPGTANFVTENAAGMHAYGFEADVAYKPIPDLTLAGNLGLEQGHYVDPSASTRQQQQTCLAGIRSGNAAEQGDCGQGIVNGGGKLAPPENFPPVTFTLRSVYDFDYGNLHIQPIAAVQFSGTSHVDTQGSLDGISPPHYLLDLGVHFQFHESAWALTAECENCTNQKYETSLLFVKYYSVPGIWDLKLHRSF
jgi:iron complex outermembrane receptor protein